MDADDYYRDDAYERPGEGKDSKKQGLHGGTGVLNLLINGFLAYYFY